MKFFRGKYLNDFFKDLIERYDFSEDDLDRVIAIKEVIDNYGKNISGYNDESDDEFYELEDFEDWKEKYDELKKKYRERFFEASEKEEPEEEKTDDGEDYEDVKIDNVLYENDENKEEK